jgi:FAD/FMN-containing dehydrogenase
MKRRDFLRASVAAATALGPARQLFAAKLGVLAQGAGSLAAVTLGGSETSIPADHIESLAQSMYGAVVLPGDANYDSTRAIWNGVFDRRPALIARCVGSADVTHAVNFAREHNLLTAVRGGGHNYAGKSMCDGGIVIDTSPMRAVEVNASARTARVAAGTLLGQLDFETMHHGLGTTAGVVSHTGCAGLTLGGGMGRYMRKFGLAVDNLLSVDIVTAAGERLHASETSNPDLYWGLRGGGGNFGVATAFEYRLYPTNRNVFSGFVAWPLAKAPDVLDYWFDFCADAPGDLQMTAVMTRGGDGSPLVGVSGCWSGDVAKGEEVLSKLRNLGKPIFDTFAPVPYLAIQSSGDESSAHGRLYYAKAGFTPALDRDDGKRIADVFEAASTGYTMLIDQGGGAVGEVPTEATAFPNRDAKFWLSVDGNWDDPAETDSRIAGMRSDWKHLESLTSGFYTNGAIDESASQFRSNYGANFPRLQGLKDRYDPQNMFRLNANVPPSA